jgi:sugar phosphate isomerase/epimerase
MIQTDLNRLAVCELSTFRWSFEEDILHYASQGFGGVGIWRYKLHEYGEAKAVELMRECKMKVSSLHWAGGFTGSDGRSYQESLMDGLDAVDVAAEVGANCLVVLVGGRAGHTKPHARRLAKGALKELAEAALAKNVQLAVEPMHAGCAERWTMLTELPMTLDLISEVDCSNIGVVLDAYHLAHDPNILNWIPSILPLVRLVQLGDAKSAPVLEQNRCSLGEGNLPLCELVQVLEANHYSGFYEIEVLGEQVEHIGYEKLLDQAKNAWKSWIMPQELN